MKQPTSNFLLTFVAILISLHLIWKSRLIRVLGINDQRGVDWKTVHLTTSSRREDERPVRFLTCDSMERTMIHIQVVWVDAFRACGGLLENWLNNCTLR